MKKFFYFLLFLFLSVLGVTFTIQNPQDVVVQYYLGFTWRGPLVILVSASLAIGIVIGSLAALTKNLRLRRRYSRLEKANPAVTDHKKHSTVVANPET
ncbi:MAG: LapA family protein [Pseudomonadales bacterium]|nr:LapA family protein [Pseudomonadales bacterium]